MPLKQRKVKCAKGFGPDLFTAEFRADGSELKKGDVFRRDHVAIHFDRAEHLYAQWPSPTCIISDGPYGVSGFPGDEHEWSSLAAWYEPHIRDWAQCSTPQTTLWFWNTEVGWATVHPVLVKHGWEYRCCNIWDKGMSHVAGNANTQTLRKFPVVTEVCVHYVKAALFRVGERTMTMQEWLRHEWLRSGLALRLASKACGVLNAATRKYLTADHLWYYPPTEAFVKLADYANRYGKPRVGRISAWTGIGPFPAKNGGRCARSFSVRLASPTSGESRKSTAQNGFRASGTA